MSLEQILIKYGIQIKDSNGDFRNSVDILEDMYLKLTGNEFNRILYEVSEEERYADVFDDCRGRKYKGDE